MLNLGILTLAFAFHTPVFGTIQLKTERTLSTNNGDRLNLQCTDRDINLLRGLRRFTWTKDHIIIPETDPRLNRPTRNNLVVLQVREKDAGRYNCSVEAQGFLSVSVTILQVFGKDPPSPTTSLPTIQSLPSSTQTNLLAVASIAMTVNASSTLQLRIPQPSTPEPSTPQPSTPKPSSPKPSSPKPSTPEPSTPKPSTPKPSTPKPSGPTPFSDQISDLQRKVADLRTGNYTNVSSLITELVNFTTPQKEETMTSNELSSSLDMLVQLVSFNSERNNSAINSTKDQENIVQIASNLLEEENVNLWLQLQEVLDDITDEVLKVMDDFASQLMGHLENLENSSSLVILSKNIGFRADRLKTRQKLFVNFSDYGTSISIPREALSPNSTIQASVIVYKTLNKILGLRKESASKEDTGTQRITSGSNIISATIFPRPTNLTTAPIKFVFHHTDKSNDTTGQCVFWEIGLPKRAWLTRGCERVDQESNLRVTTCECNHLTIFAVLLNNKPVEAHHDSNLQYISILGCVCSLGFLLMTFIVIAVCWRQIRSARVTMLLHLCIAISASCILILVTGFVQWEELGCLISAALLHYFLLCVFTLMLCHGGIFYYLIIRAELRDKLKPKIKWFCLFGWAFPALIVSASLSVTGTKNYAASNCWLTLENGLIYWAFVAPVAAVVFINCVLFIFLLHHIHRVSKLRDRMTRTQHLRAWLRRSSVLLPVLGITWSFGFLTYISSTTLFHYLFTVCNTLQGFIIFVNFCIIDTEVRKALFDTLCRRNRSSFLTGSKGGTMSKEQGNSQMELKFPEEMQTEPTEKIHVINGHNVVIKEIFQTSIGLIIQQPRNQIWMTDCL
ncbi:adhesion G protein-coupled receptor L4-like isoform X2 [Montipora capricornis]|uniref:adhesion G protein-coupled receptor L4-like isoform X2 n=1 Tax=Montipora capricornis TaxID=246305 RepID=UPI0035F199B6